MPFTPWLSDSMLLYVFLIFHFVFDMVNGNYWNVAITIINIAMVYGRLTLTVVIVVKVMYKIRSKITQSNLH